MHCSCLCVLFTLPASDVPRVNTKQSGTSFPQRAKSGDMYLELLPGAPWKREPGEGSVVKKNSKTVEWAPQEKYEINGYLEYGMIMI